ncbi:MAG: response regulator [Candidatus Aminicenantes bacterium]|nr:response regulator [Candidatus Aminicenantes bacterium]
MKKKILLIEDEQDMNFRLINQLKECYDLEIAVSIDAAINLLKLGKDFELIFLDIMMPPGPYSSEVTNDGIETGWIFYERELRQRPTKVVIWTRNSDILNKPWGRNVVERLIKSNDESQLLDTARKHLGE